MYNLSFKLADKTKSKKDKKVKESKLYDATIVLNDKTFVAQVEIDEGTFQYLPLSVDSFNCKGIKVIYFQDKNKYRRKKEWVAVIRQEINTSSNLGKPYYPFKPGSKVKGRIIDGIIKQFKIYKYYNEFKITSERGK